MILLAQNEGPDLTARMPSVRICPETCFGIARTMEKFVRDMRSLSHSGLIIAPGQEANEDNLGGSFRSSIK